MYWRDSIGTEPDGIIFVLALPELADRLITYGLKLLTEAAERMRLSARGYHRVLRVARTLADLDGGGPILRLHIAEALSTRRVIAGRNSLLAG